MPLQIIKANVVNTDAEFIISDRELEAALKEKGSLVEQLELLYSGWLKKAKAEKKTILRLPCVKAKLVGIPQETLKLMTMDLIRKAMSAQEEEEEEQLVYLAIEENGFSETRRLYPELAQALARNLPQPRISYSCNCFCESAKPRDTEDKQQYLNQKCLDLEECSEANSDCLAIPGFFKEQELEELIKHKPLTFSQLLMKLLDERAISDVDFYKRANIDRKLFSKIRNKDYRPSKNTVLAAVISLRLSASEAEKLMASAGYTWNESDNTDIIVRFFLNRGEFDIDRVNLVLYEYGEKILGAKMA